LHISQDKIGLGYSLCVWHLLITAGEVDRFLWN